jgi:hypothetical protein
LIIINILVEILLSLAAVAEEVKDISMIPVQMFVPAIVDRSPSLYVEDGYVDGE